MNKDYCIKCQKQFNRCLVCSHCQNLVCYNCALCLSDPSVEYDSFFCSKICLMHFTDDEYEHGNGD